MKRYRDDLDERGGRRVIVDLEPPGAQALADLIARDGEPAKGAVKRVITAALIKAAQEPR
jgi:hypothetical protein